MHRQVGTAPLGGCADLADGVLACAGGEHDRARDLLEDAVYRDFFRETFGPIVGLRASLAERPGRLAALDRDFLEFATRSNQAAPGEPAEYRYEYLLVVGVTR